MEDTVKLLIELPKKTVEHIRSDYGHGCKVMYIDDKNEIVDAIYNATKLDSVVKLDAPKWHALCTPRKDDVGDDPMIGIVWYNGLDDIVIKWKDYKKSDDVPYYAYDPSVSDLTSSAYRQLEMVWMYLVLCFGDYGTSPRSGWIEDFEGYKKWFEELEELRKPVL